MSRREEVFMQKCSICGKNYDGYGNNAQPVNNGRCCDECNFKVVIPIRIKKARNHARTNMEMAISQPQNCETR